MTTNVLFKLLLIILQTIFCLTCLIATLPNGYYNNLYGIPVFIVTFSTTLISLILINTVLSSARNKIQKFLLHNLICSILTFIPVLGWIAITYNFIISVFVINITIGSLVTNNRNLKEDQSDDQDLTKLFTSTKENETSSSQKKRKVVNKYSR